MNRSIILIGLKHSGKTTMADMVSETLEYESIDLDRIIERRYRGDSAVSVRDIYRSLGREGFRELEAEAARVLADVLQRGNTVAALGGGTVDNHAAMEIVRPHGIVVFLREREEILFDRIMKGGLPAFLPENSPRQAFHALFERRDAACLEYADIIMDLRDRDRSDRFVSERSLQATLERLTSLLSEHGYAG